MLKNTSNLRRLRSVIREAIYTNDYSVTEDEISALEQSILSVAKQAERLGFASTSSQLMELIDDGSEVILAYKEL